MKRGLKIALSVLILLLVVLSVGYYLTSGGAPVVTRKGSATQATRYVVKQREWRTAKNFAANVSTAEELPFAQEAVRLADHEVDVAFTCALLQDDLHPVDDSPQVKAAKQKIKALEAAVKADQEQVGRAQQEAQKSASDDAQEGAQLAQANLTLHQDELESARQELQDAGGDIASRIKNERAWHEKTDQATPISAAAARMQFAVDGNLVSQAMQWWTLLQRQREIQRAKETAYESARTMNLPAMASSANVQSTEPSHAERLKQLHDAAIVKRLQTAYAERRDDEVQLSKIYEQWEAALASQRQLVLHVMLRSFGFIVMVLLALAIGEIFIARLRAEQRGDRRRINSMKMMARFASQGIAILIILLILFGPPKQLSTILAFAGAGLTVAMKDFIIAFFGWFVLMGRNGIRVGDWVEINGVGGEVLEIGILRTVILETGNWSDAGHPTGRKVAFVNSFAVEGHYFNFTTSGQWLWDQLDVAIPADSNPFELADEIRRVVSQGTKDEAEQAEAEWKRATHHIGPQQISAEPAVNIRPTATGITVTVRYIANAGMRYQVRSKLYHEIVEMLHRKAAAKATT
jgi:small-conductance mechanosensitive channel